MGTAARASFASSGYGAAGSLAVILVWVYYTSQIVLLGAELTRGSSSDPTRNATRSGKR